MQSTHTSAKGKGRAEGDHAQSFASLSLSDPDNHPTSRNNSYESSYPDVYGSSYKQPYHGDDQYGWMAQSSQAPSAAYSGTPGYGNSYPTTSPTVSTEGYDYQNESSGKSYYSSYAGYDTASATDSSVSSYGGGSLARWSDSQSRDTVASSKPSAHSHQTNVKNTINHQRLSNERNQLPCEFHNLTGCDRVFTTDDEHGWVEHVEEHLKSKFPTRLRCWFCSDQRFDARETSGGDARSNFITRMGHIRDHFAYDGFRREQIIADGYLVQHLLDRNIIDRRTYESIVNPTPVPPIPAGRRNSHRSHHGHRRLSQVKEEVVPESSGSRHHSRSEHKREHHREHSTHSRTHHRSNRGRQNREGHRKPHSVPSVVSLDEAVPQTPVPKGDCSSPMKLENTSASGSRNSSSNAASRQPASKHSDEQSITHVDDESTTNIVANELHKLNIGHMGETSNDSPGRIESPQSEDHSDVRPSSCSTDTTTPESGSFWLGEDSEEEDKRLDEDHPFNQYRALAVTRVFKAFHSWKESYSEQDTPCDGVETNHTPNKYKGKGKDSGTRKRKPADRSETNNSKDNSKRPSSNPTPNEDKGKGKDSGKRADQSETNNGKDNSNGPSSSRVGCSKRRRTSDRQLTFACPYTKKDPMSYRDCYRYKLSRIRDVKQHLVRCHRNPPYCPRCMDTFETEEERDEHIRASSCPLRLSVRLDGITESQRSQLAKKSASNTSPEAQWFAVFDIVFPGHKPRPLSPYVDSELLQDITLYQDFLTSHGPRILSRVLDEQGVVTWHLPNEERDLAAFRQEIFEEGLREVFDQWLARRSSSSQTPSVTSSSGGTARNTPPSSSNSGERVDSTSAHASTAGPPESSGNRSGGRSADAHLDTEHLQEASSDQVPLGEVLDGSYNLEHGNSDFLSGLTYDGSDDELTRFFMDG